jgi:5-methylcytosine-specific restriction endonuclease McrA
MGHPIFIGGFQDLVWLADTTFGSGIAKTLVREAIASGGDAALRLNYADMARRFEFTEAEIRTAVGHLLVYDFARIERNYERGPGEWLLILTPGRLAEDAREQVKRAQKVAEQAVKLALRGGQVRRRAIPPDVRNFVFERDDHRCVKCGATEDLALDHVHPWSLGGPDTADNLQVLCRPCNSRKGDRVPALSV